MAYSLTVGRVRDEIQRDGAQTFEAGSALAADKGRLDLGTAYRRMAFEDTWCGGLTIALQLEVQAQDPQSPRAR
jgi:hypothetical protein